MFDLAGDDVLTLAPPRESSATNCVVIRFGAAAGEDEFVGRAVQQSGHLRSCRLNGLVGFPPIPMGTGRVPEVLLKVRTHRLDDLGIKRRRGVVVQINRLSQFIHGSSAPHQQ